MIDRSMDAELLFRIVFVFYCTTVGIVLICAPWTQGWEQMVAHLPYPGVRSLASPVLRAGLSGFGAVHLVWSVHDVDALLRGGTNGSGTPR